jgi:hypothetical protein
MSTEMVLFGASEVVLVRYKHTHIYIDTYVYTLYIYMYIKGYAKYVML